jgi:adenylate cyclase
MLGAATSHESLDAIAYLPIAGPLRRWRRGGTSVEIVERSLVTSADDIVKVAAETRKASWSVPLISRVTGRGLIPYRHPVVRDGVLIGVVLAVVSWDSKSSMLMSQSANLVPFVLYGRDNVFIHANMASMAINEQQLPRLDGVSDPYLALMWKDPRPTALGDSARSKVHWTWAGQSYEARVYAYREITGYSATPWLIGYHQSSLETLRVRWVVQAIFYGSIMLAILCIFVSWLLAKRAMIPVGQIAKAARSLEKLDFAGVSRSLVHNSRLTEVNDTSHALQSAARALQLFQTYVPRALVSQVMTIENDATRAADREVTILFMDLEGYTRYSAGRPAADVGAYLNAIFGRVGPVIEAHGGSIDKYTGDGLMAVWGAPVVDPNHTERAWEAALAIVAVLQAHVKAERAGDAGTCRVRFGLHSGRVLAGDIGFAGRMDYTVIGRTVNTAQRTQAALRNKMGDDDIALAVTGTIVRTLALPAERLQKLADLPDGDSVYRVTN